MIAITNLADLERECGAKREPDHEPEYVVARAPCVGELMASCGARVRALWIDDRQQVLGIVDALSVADPEMVIDDRVLAALGLDLDRIEALVRGDPLRLRCTRRR